MGTEYTVIATPGGHEASGPESPITVTGLENGQPHVFTVIATNEVGPSPASPTSDPVTCFSRPDPPTGLGASRGESQAAVVTFTPPVNDGGTPILDYVATSSPGGIQATNTASPITVTGLTNGTSYTFTVQARNSIGLSNASSSSPAVIAAGAPLAPPIGTPTAGYQQAVVFFSPANGNGLPVLDYTATASPGGAQTTGASAPLVVTGLTAGQAYTFTVTARNAVGVGAASVASSAVTPYTLPSAPTVGTATPVNYNSVQVTFSPPASDGWSPITSYTVTSSPGGLTGSGAASPVTITGLTPEVEYRFTVAAVNAAGTGPASALSNWTETAYTVPATMATPTTVSPSNNSVWASGVAPSNGGTAIIAYEAMCVENGIICTGSNPASPAVYLTLGGVTGSYTLKIRAVNKVGAGAWSPASAPVSITVTQASAPPSPPSTPPPCLVDATYNYMVNVTCGTLPTYTGATAISAYYAHRDTTDTGTAAPPGPVRIYSTGQGSQTFFSTKVQNAGGYWSALSAGTNYSLTYGPHAPTSPVATGNTGGTTATVNCTPPVYKGTSAGIMSYKAQAYDASYNKLYGISGTGSLPVSVPNCPVGVNLYFKIKALSNAPNSEYGPYSEFTSTPVQVNYGPPGAPTSPSGTVDDQQSTITFTAPTSDGGSPIIDYRVTSSPGGITADGLASPITITGLTNGQAYTFTVKARNSIGYGADSSPTSSITPRVITVPGAPTIGTATAGVGAATVQFTPPADNGGRPILNYKATSNPGGLEGNGGGSPITVTGLTNGTPYTFTVTATNVIGTSAPSAASNSVTPTASSVPSPPLSLGAIPGDQNLQFMWSPNGDGGSPILDYTWYCRQGASLIQSATTSSTFASISGLTNGVQYTLTVTARNAIGSSVESSPEYATPNVFVPDTPVIGDVMAGPFSNEVLVLIQPTGDGGAPIQMLEATCVETGEIFSTPWDQTAQVQGYAYVQCTLGAASNGTSRTFTGRCYNRVGASPDATGPYPAWVEWTEPVYPSGGTIISVTPQDGAVLVNFSVPSYAGGSGISDIYITYMAEGGVAAGTVTATGIPHTVSGLTNGVNYRFAVKALNTDFYEGGLGNVSANAKPVAATVPGAPTITGTTPGNGTISVAFTAPASDGGSAIQCYEACTSPGFTGTTLVSSATSPILLAGLTPGPPYNIYVRAVNKVGAGGPAMTTSGPSSYSPPNQPNGAAITGVSTTPGFGNATVYFNPPSWNGGSGIASYRVYIYPAHPLGFSYYSGASSPILVDQLTMFQNYRFGVAAVTTTSAVGPAGSKSNNIVPG